MNTATAAVVDGKLSPITANDAKHLIVGTHLTAQGLVDKISALQSEVDGVGSTKMNHLLSDLVNFPLTSGLDFIREARKLVVGDTPVKEQEPAQKSRAKRLTETKSMFTCLKLVHDSDPNAFKKVGANGWNAAYAYSVKALEHKGLTANGGTYISPEQRAMDKAAQFEGASVTEARKVLGPQARMEDVLVKAVEVRQAILSQIDNNNAPDALVKLGKLLSGAVIAAESLIRGESFRTTLPEGLAHADYWRAQIEEYKRISRIALDWEKQAEKAKAEAEAVLHPVTSPGVQDTAMQIAMNEAKAA